MRWLSLAELVRFSCFGGGTGGNSVRCVSHEKVTTDGVLTSGVRLLSGRSGLRVPLSPGTHATFQNLPWTAGKRSRAQFPTTA